MKIEMIKISQLKDSDYNPRKKLKPGDVEYEKIKKSIKEFGIVEPLVINSKKEIIGGHQRKTVAKNLKYKELPCYTVDDMSPEKEKALNIALNKISGEWDDEKLFEVLQDLKIDENDFLLTGFDFSEFDELFKQYDNAGYEYSKSGEGTHGKEDDFDVDKELEEIEEPETKRGDIYLLGEHRLMCGDSTDKNDVDVLINNNKIDMVFTDPPYGVDYSSKNEQLNKLDGGKRIQKEIKNDNIKDYKEFFKSFLELIPFSDYNTFYITMSSMELHNLRLAIEESKYKWCDYLVWVKNNHVLGKKDYNSKHEFIVYGWKGKHKFYGDFSTTVLEYNKPLKNVLHPTMKPIELICKLINDGSLEGMNIYDGFGGSGSTLIACEQLKRNCFMMELDEKYCDVIVNRWETYTEQSAKRIKR